MFGEMMVIDMQSYLPLTSSLENVSKKFLLKISDNFEKKIDLNDRVPTNKQKIHYLYIQTK